MPFSADSMVWLSEHVPVFTQISKTALPSAGSNMSLHCDDDDDAPPQPHPAAAASHTSSMRAITFSFISDRCNSSRQVYNLFTNFFFN